MTMRNYTLEKALCEAIKKHLIVRLQYKKELFWRTFEPYAVYESTKDKILVAGSQTKNDSKPLEPAEPRNFEPSLISSLKLTDKIFKYDVRFDRYDKKFAHGFICVIHPTAVK